MTPAVLAERLQSPTATMLEGFIGSIIQQGIKSGDQSRLSFLFDRTIGKVKEQVEVTQIAPFIVRHLNGETTVMGVEAGKDDEA